MDSIAFAVVNLKRPGLVDILSDVDNAGAYKGQPVNMRRKDGTWKGARKWDKDCKGL